MAAIFILAGPEQLDSGFDRFSHGGRTRSGKVSWKKVVDACKLRLNGDRSKSNDRNFDALHGQAVSLQLVAKGDKAVVELRDRVAGHGRGRVKEQHTRAAWLGVVGKLGAPERDLVFHRFLPYR